MGGVSVAEVVMGEFMHELWVDPATPAKSFLVRAETAGDAATTVPIELGSTYDPGSAWKCYQIDTEPFYAGLWRVNYWFTLPEPYKLPRRMNCIERLLVWLGCREPMPSICSSQLASCK
jgi:hypothetical protein